MARSFLLLYAPALLVLVASVLYVLWPALVRLLGKLGQNRLLRRTAIGYLLVLAIAFLWQRPWHHGVDSSEGTSDPAGLELPGVDNLLRAKLQEKDVLIAVAISGGGLERPTLVLRC